MLQTTDEHPFWVVGMGWVKAGELQVGQQFLTADGDLVTLSTTSSEEHPEGISVYNLTVEEDHTFFVSATSGDEMVWVHNEDTGAPDESHPDGAAKPAGCLDKGATAHFRNANRVWGACRIEQWPRPAKREKGVKKKKRGSKPICTARDADRPSR